MGNTVIGERIAARRKALGLTLDDIAAELGVAKSTISRYEKGNIENLKLPVIEAIARVLRVDPAWLIGKSDEMDPIASPAVSDDDIKFALFGGGGEITDEMYEEVKRFAAFVRQREKEKSEGGKK
ncbi:MAG: helix-turn-helix transcriptional regulator [Clostridia bacterium]|nr:helix-turn-helix transcriptional regulator [Clostridia bacterium]